DSVMTAMTIVLFFFVKQLSEYVFFFSSRRRHTRSDRDWSSDVCSSDLSDSGRKWLEELAVSRDPWFNINVGDGFYHYHRSWNDDLSLPFSALPGYIANAKAGECIERPIEKLMAERKQLIEDYRELLNIDEERAAYDQMI